MRERIRQLIDHIGMIMADGKLDTDNAHKLMYEVANLHGEVEAELAKAHASERWMRSLRELDKKPEVKP